MPVIRLQSLLGAVAGPIRGLLPLPRFLVAIILALVVPADLASAPQETTWETHLQSAREALAQDRLPQFRTEISAAVEASRAQADEAIALSDSLMVWADSLRTSSRNDEAELLLTNAVELRSGAYGPRDWPVAEPLHRLGEIALARQNYPEAEKFFLEALSIRQESLGEYHVDVIDTYHAIGSLYLAQDRVLKADEILAQAIALRTRTTPSDSARFADELDEVAQVYERHERYEKADPLRERSQELRAALWGEDAARYIYALANYARFQHRSRPEVAERLYQDALSLAKEHHGTESAVTARVLSLLAFLRASQDQYDEAASLFRRAIQGRIGAMKAGGLTPNEIRALSVAIVDDMARVAFIDAQHGRHSQAAVQYDQAVSGLMKLELQGDRFDNWMRRAGVAHRNAGNYDIALERLRSLVEHRKQVQGDNALGVANALEEVADTYWMKGDHAAATTEYERMVAVLETHDPPPPTVTQKLYKLASIYQQQGRMDEANRMNRRALGVTLARLNLAAKLGPKKWSLGLLAVGLAGGIVVVAIWGGAALSERMLPTVAPAQAEQLPARADAPLEWPRAVSEETPPMPQEPMPGAPAEAEPHPSFPEDSLHDSPRESFSTTLPEPSAAEPAAHLEEQPLVWSGDADVPGEPADPLSAPPPSPAPESRYDFRFQGDGGSLFSIWVVNLLLTLVTFGIYYFWGKAKIRRYLYSSTSFDNDSFEFHGTGRELLIGWLKALPFLLLFAYGPTLLMLVWKSMYAQLVGGLVVMAVLLVVWPLAVVGAFRYRLSRSSWRRIRFSFRGRKRGYVMLAVGSLLMSIVTLGLASPFRGVWLRRYLFDQAWFGNTRFRFFGKGSDLFGPFVIAVALTIPTLGLYWLWYRAQRENYYWSRTVFGGARFACTLTGWKYLKLYAGNLLLLLGTLGLAWPWVLTRTANLRLNNLFVEGSLDFSAIEQDARAATATGEGFADFLGLDFGI